MDDVTAADELLATCWTTAGDAAPSREDWRSPVPLRERIEAAAAAGFTGFGVLAFHLALAEREPGLAATRTRLADGGIVRRGREGLREWGRGGPERGRWDGLRRSLRGAAAAPGPRHLRAPPDTSGAPWEPEPWAAEFARLAAQAA